MAARTYSQKNKRQVGWREGLYVRGITHALHSASRNDGFVTTRNALGREHNGLKATSTDLVDRSSVRARLHASTEGDLTCW